MQPYKRAENAVLQRVVFPVIAGLEKIVKLVVLTPLEDTANLEIQIICGLHRFDQIIQNTNTHGLCFSTMLIWATYIRLALTMSVVSETPISEGNWCRVASGKKYNSKKCDQANYFPASIYAQLNKNA